jgi:hypothetical protein
MMRKASWISQILRSSSLRRFFEEDRVVVVFGGASLIPGCGEGVEWESSEKG